MTGEPETSLRDELEQGLEAPEIETPELEAPEG